MINKNQYRKTDTKKVLHKVGKQWKVISTALLLAVAGGATAVATTNANAANTSNDNNNEEVNSEVDALNTPAAANAPQFAQPSSATSASASAKPASSSAIHYYNGSNGSAASYFDRVDNDNSVANKYYKTVQSYVNSLTSEYQPQVSSFVALSGSAKSATSNDSALAKSYSATVQNPNTMNTINSLAAKNSMDPTLYQNLVQDNEQTYSNEVSGASADVKAASDVSSIVNSLENMNFSSASLSASTASVVAKSNYLGAQAVSESVSARFNPTNNNAGNYLDIANKLRAGVTTLQAQGDPRGYNAQLSMLLNYNNFNATEQGYAQSAVNSAVASEVKSANAYYNSLASESDNVSDLESYADGTFDTLVSSGDAALSAANPTDPDLQANNKAESEYTAAVSAATAEQFAATLQSAATSLYGQYNPEFISSQELSTESSAAKASADAKVRAASIASNVASDNQFIIDAASLAIQSSGANGVASLVAKGLSQGLTSVESNANIIQHPSSTYSSPITNSTNYVDNALVAALPHNEQGLANYIIGRNPQSIGQKGKPTEAQASQNLKDAAKDLDGIDFTKANNTNAGNDVSSTNELVNSDTSFNDLVTNHKLQNSKSLNAQSQKLLTSSVVNAALAYSPASDNVKALSNSTTMSDLNHAVNVIQGVLHDLATVNFKANSNDGLTTYTHYNEYQTTTAFTNILGQKFNNYGNDMKAALLSDGIDVDALDREADAISDVATTAKNAIVSASNNNSNFNSASYADNLNSALGVAASSANSALTSTENASANYSAANDEDVTLASYFASSYTSDANSESGVAVSASSALNGFFQSEAADPTFTSADSSYASAVNAASNDYKMGVANAQSIYNNNAHFLNVTKGARLHSTPNFGSKKYNDKVVGSVKKGDRLTVYGVNVSRNNDWRGVVRYYVKDNTNGAKGFITGQPDFTTPAYLSATANHANVEVKTLKPVNVYSEINGKKAIATIPAGKVLQNASVVYDNNAHDAYGFTKVETASYDFLTANTDYVAIYVPAMPTNNTPKSNFSFNLNNGEQRMADYYNNLSQN